jgi:ERCC4-type nuclease
MLFAARQAHTYAAGALPRHGWRPRGKYARQLYILQGFPNIGPERARRLLARFGSVEAIVNARPEVLRAVTGVGKQVAEKLRWAVEEPPYKHSQYSGFGAADSADTKPQS